MPDFTLQRYGTPFLGCITFPTARDVISHETCIFAAGRVNYTLWACNFCWLSDLTKKPCVFYMPMCVFWFLLLGEVQRGTAFNKHKNSHYVKITTEYLDIKNRCIIFAQDIR